MAGVEAERAHAAKVQDALYRIAELASAAHGMSEFYAAVHEVVSELMDARNFYIALYDEQRKRINFPYFVDDVDPEIPDPNRWDDFGTRDARGVTAYVLRTGRPELLTLDRFHELVAQGEVELIGVTTDDGTWVE